MNQPIYMYPAKQEMRIKNPPFAVVGLTSTSTHVNVHVCACV